MTNSTVEIDTSNPYKNDCFKIYKEIACNLTRIIKSNNTNVTCISSSWGTGKTTFCKMWEADLKNNYSVLYYDAFLNDFFESPLISLVSSIISNLDHINDTNWDDIKTTLLNISKKTVSLLTSGLLDLKSIENDLSENKNRKTIIEYYKITQKIVSIKELFIEVKNKISPDKPIFFLVDELDRCKPSFTLDLLEIIKHFFDMEGFCFILFLDKAQLNNMIELRYGNNKIGNDYIKKFIDFEYSLPSPNLDEYITLKNQTNKCFIKDIFYQHLLFFSGFFSLNLRDIDKIFYLFNIVSSYSKTLLNSNKTNYPDLSRYAISLLYTFFITISVSNPQEFRKILDKSYNTDFINSMHIKTGYDPFDNYALSFLKMAIRVHTGEEDKQILNTYTFTNMRESYDNVHLHLFFNSSSLIVLEDLSFLNLS